MHCNLEASDPLAAIADRCKVFIRFRGGMGIGVCGVGHCDVGVVTVGVIEGVGRRNKHCAHCTYAVL